jgi:hypothetical protein
MNPSPQDDMVPEQIKGTGYFTPMDIAPGEVITSPQDDIDELRNWLVGSFKAFLEDDPTRTTGASCQIAADYAIRRFEALIHDREKAAAKRIEELEQELEKLYKASGIS